MKIIVFEGFINLDFILFTLTEENPRMDYFEDEMLQDLFLSNADLSSRTYTYEQKNREKGYVIERAYDFYEANANDITYARYETVRDENTKVVPTVSTACLADIATRLSEVFDNISESRKGDVTFMAVPIVKFTKWFDEFKKLYSDYYLYLYNNRAVSWAYYIRNPEPAFEEIFFEDSEISFGANICIEKAEFAVLLQALKYKLIEAQERLTTYSQPKHKGRFDDNATDIAKTSAENAFPEKLKKAFGRFLGKQPIPCADSIVL